MDGGRKIRNAHLFQPLGGKSGRSHRHVEHLGYAGAYGAFILRLVAEHHIVGHDTGLPVGRSGEEVQPRLTVMG